MLIVGFKTSGRDQREIPFIRQGRASSVRGAPLMLGHTGSFIQSFVLCQDPSLAYAWN